MSYLKNYYAEQKEKKQLKKSQRKIIDAFIDSLYGNDQVYTSIKFLVELFQENEEYLNEKSTQHINDLVTESINSVEPSIVINFLKDFKRVPEPSFELSISERFSCFILKIKNKLNFS
jgi:NADH:ubiquinone oxidoreductase subunit E